MFVFLIFPLICSLWSHHTLSGYNQPKLPCQLCQWRHGEWGFKHSCPTQSPSLQLAFAAMTACQLSEEEYNPAAPSHLLLYCFRSDRQQPERIPSAGGIIIFALRWQQHPESIFEGPHRGADPRLLLQPKGQHLGEVRGNHFPQDWCLSGLALAALASLGTKVPCQCKAFHLGWISKASSLRENYLAF